MKLLAKHQWLLLATMVVIEILFFILSKDTVEQSITAVSRNNEALYMASGLLYMLTFVLHVIIVAPVYFADLIFGLVTGSTTGSLISGIFMDQDKGIMGLFYFYPTVAGYVAGLALWIFIFLYQNRKRLKNSVVVTNK